MNPNRQADWPKQREIFTHLQITPWLMLPVAFDHEACLQEALALLDRFVVHRPDSQKGKKGKWKSLSIRAAGGDAARTQAEEQYGSSDAEAVYRLTEIAERCPHTIQFLRSVTDLDRCARVRFMLLEPGAEIECHSDAPEKAHSLALNIALNMPRDCEFWVDLLPDGTGSRFSHRIPITDGSAFLFNTATYHRVANHSDQPRVHIIVHGPTYFTDEELIMAARKQNQLANHEAALCALVSKQALLGRAPVASAKSELQNIGSIKGFPPHIAFGVCRESLEDPLLEEESFQLTRAGLFPLIPEAFPQSLLDEWLLQRAREGKEVAVVLNAGNFISSQVDFICATLEASARMQAGGIPLVAHLADKPGRLPYLHEQFFLMDLRQWQALGSPSLGVPEKWHDTTFPAFLRSEESVHGAHAPYWLARDEAVPLDQPLHGRGGFGTLLLARMLEAGKRVETTPLALRNEKTYAYPRAGRAENYVKVKREVDAFLAASERQFFVFNTERLRLREYGIRPTVIFSPCSGLKPISLLRQFSQGSDDCRLVFLERSGPAIAHYRRLLACQSYKEVIALLEDVLRERNHLPPDPKYVKATLQPMLTEAFDGDAAELMRWLKKAATLSAFHQLDYLSAHEEIVEKIRPDDRPLFWHSNAWESTPALYRMSMASLMQNYRDLAGRIAERLGAPAWMHKATFDAIIGPDVLEPWAVLSVGGGKMNPPRRGAYEPLCPTRSPARSVLFQST